MQIKLLNILKKYGETVVLDIKELGFLEGKITGIIGENGAGKTTLLKIIAGLDNEYSGKTLYNNKEYSNEIQQDISIMFQNPFGLKRSVFENITYPLKIRKQSKFTINSKVKEIMKSVGISHLSHKNGSKLSGGETQKMALARAIVFTPKLLILDEPFSRIDSKSIELLEQTVKNYNIDKKATVLIVTHSLDQAKRLCDNIVYLDNGKVKA